MDRIAKDFFIATEVEHSPAFGQKTLFVVGIQDPNKIIQLAQSNQCTHVYFGANQSFQVNGTNDADGWMVWEEMIRKVLTSSNFYCTLDIDVKDTEGLLESFLIEHNRFIPMISVKLPYTGLLNYNTTIKIDDIDFDKSNPGVWCHLLHELMDRKKFTPWADYSNDTPLTKGS